MLSKESLQQFKDIYRQEFGVELSDAAATELAVSLLTFFNHIYRPVQRAWLGELPNYPKPKQKPDIKA
jgi:hypothetical protein